MAKQNQEWLVTIRMTETPSIIGALFAPSVFQNFIANSLSATDLKVFGLTVNAVSADIVQSEEATK